MEESQAYIRADRWKVAENLNQITMKVCFLVVQPKKGTPMRSKLPGTTHTQAENIRLLGRDVKAAVKHHIDGLLHLWKTMILWKTKIPICPTHLGTAFQTVWKSSHLLQTSLSYSTLKINLFPLKEKNCHQWLKYQVPQMSVWRKMVAWLPLLRLAWITAREHMQQNLASLTLVGNH